MPPIVKFSPTFQALLWAALVGATGLAACGSETAADDAGTPKGLSGVLPPEDAGTPAADGGETTAGGGGDGEGNEGPEEGAADEGEEGSGGTEGAGEPPCVPMCDGKQCGDNGCFGSCGACPAGTSCAAGVCEGTPTPAAVIIPGQGIDFPPAGGAAISLRVGADFSAVSTQLGGPGTPIVVEGKTSEFSREYPALGVALLYLDNQDDNVLGNGDKLNRILTAEGFTGATAQGAKLGDAPAVWQAELGAADKTGTASGGESVETWFLKGITIASQPGAGVFSVSIFRPTKVIPNAEIQYKSYRLGPPLNVVADIPDGQDFASVAANLGPPDLMASEGQLNTQTWVDLGVTVINGNGKPSVNAIAVTAPYFGVLEGTALRVGATRQEVEAALGPPTGQRNEAGVTIDYYQTGTKKVFILTFVRSLGIIYTDSGTVGSFMVGYAFEP